jgi:Fur family ferric uptake transcriptional regulator
MSGTTERRSPPRARDDRRAASAWSEVPERLHSRGLRWTPQRRALVDVLSRTGGHVTGAELVERCRALDPTTAPSTIYRTLDVLEDLGLVSHSHGLDGREEYHVLPNGEHAHLHCTVCGGAWEISPAEAAALVQTLAAARGFEVDLSHVTIAGVCARCAAAR